MELFDTQGLPAKSFRNQNSSQANVTGSSAKKSWNYFFLFHSDTKWQNVAPVGWFNLNKQASLSCQSADSKWQFLFGFNQKYRHFQCDISNSKVFELCICLGWRWGWSVGHLFLCILLICLFVFSYWWREAGGKDHERRRMGTACCLYPSSSVWDLQVSRQRSVMWRDPKGNNGLVCFLSRSFSQKAWGNAVGLRAHTHPCSWVCWGLVRALLASHGPHKALLPSRC